ncbi:gliding motility protein GldO [Bacteroidia bacterium]|nr:gliding motility protein GldO [Bacteroidia bacterium]
MKKTALIIGILLSVFVSQAQNNTPTSDTKAPLDGLYVKENAVGKTARPYTPVREADMYFEKRIWRQIDMREKMNQYLYYPTQQTQDRISFMGMVMKELEAGNLQAYDASTDDFTKPITYAEIMSANTTTTTKEVEDLDNPGEMIQQTTTSEFSVEDVKLLRVKEIYFIDKQRGVREIRVLGICPLIEIFDDNGVLIGTTPIFWLYYPDCREIFANYEAFNRHNSAMRMSYDDVFAYKRFFNSYIVKEDNAQDRSIQEYAVGKQVIFEGKRIEQELFNKEQDLWEY